MKRARKASWKDKLLVLAIILLGVGVTCGATSTSDAADWLQAQQDVAGWFPWTPGGGATKNTQGPSASGLLAAYLHTNAAGYLLSATATGDYMLNPMWTTLSVYTDGDPRFATHDPIFLEGLSTVTGDTQYSDFAQTYFWDKLATSTYGEADNLDAAGFGAYVVGARAGQGIVELSPWDLSATAIAAHIAGEDAICTALMGAILAGLEATVAAGGYDVTGLAGAVWASALTGIDLDPQIGVYDTANSTADLAPILSGMTLPSNDGAWLWSSTADPADPTNADTQNTAFAIMALNAFDRTTYLGQIARGVAFIRSLQQVDGQFLVYPGAPLDSTGSVEVNGEGLSAIVYTAPSTVYIDDDFTALAFGDDPAGPGIAFGYDAFGTIVDGLDAVGDSTVNVAAGTYAENPTIGKPVDLQGEGAATTTIQSNLDGCLFSYVSPHFSYYYGDRVVIVESSDVTVQGFTISGFANTETKNGSTSWGLYADGDYENIQVLDNVFTFYGQGGIRFLDVNDSIIEGNTFEADTRIVWYDPAGVTPGSYVAATRGGNGPELWGGDNVSIVGNTMVEVPSIGVFLVGSTNTHVLDNRIAAGSPADAGIHVQGTVHTDIEGNTINDFENADHPYYNHGLMGAGIAIYSTSLDTEIIRNLISDNSVGIWLSMGGPDSVIVHYNSITGNADYGVFNYGDTPQPPNGPWKTWDYGDYGDAQHDVDATLNWWGDAEGPTHATNPLGAGDSVSDHVIYSPWLGIGTDTDLTTPGFQPVADMTFIVDDVGPKPTDGYLKTALGVANAGDTVNVHAGTYNDTGLQLPAGVILIGAGASNTNLTGSGSGTITVIGNGATIGGGGTGFMILHGIDIGAGVNASTVGIHWNDIFGAVNNNGSGALNAVYNYWGTGSGTSGSVNTYPTLPMRADTSWTHANAIMGSHGLNLLNAVLALQGVADGLSYSDALEALLGGGAGSIAAIMNALGISRERAEEIGAEYNNDLSAILAASGVAWANPAATLEGALRAAYPTRYAKPAGGGGSYLGEEQLAGAGGAVVGELAVEGVYQAGEPIDLSFQLFDDQTGEPLVDANVNATICKVISGEDGGESYEALNYYGLFEYNEVSGMYSHLIDTSGLESGYYDLWLGFSDGTSERIRVEIVAS